MGLVRTTTQLATTIIRQIGDNGGVIRRDVESELDNIIAWAKLSPRRLHRNVTAVGNVGGGTDDLMSYTVPAGTLGTDGDSVKVFMSGVVSAQDGGAGDTRALVWSYAGTNLDARTISATNAACNWQIEFEVFRTSATAASYVTKFEAWNSGIDTAVLRTFGTQGTISGGGFSNANANIIKLTGNSSDAVNNDIVQQVLTVDAYLQ